MLISYWGGGFIGGGGMFGGAGACRGGGGMIPWPTPLPGPERPEGA